MSARAAKDQNWEQLAVESGYRVGALALKAGISRRHLERIFAERFAKTPGQWLYELRCRTANRRLAAGTPPKAVAAELGRYDVAHLYRELKSRLKKSRRNL